MKKVWAILIIVALAVGMLAACAAPAAEESASSPEETQAEESAAESSQATPEGEPVTITWAVFETDNFTPEFYQGIIDAFEADNPDIKIEKVLMVGDSRPQFLKTLLAAGTFPDVTMEANDLANIEGVFAEVPEEIISRFEEGALTKCFGKYTVIPAAKQYRIQCFYNKDQFEEAGITETPKTWDEFVEVCDKLTAAGKTPLICGGAKDIWATGLYWIGGANQDIMEAYPNFNEDLLAGNVTWANDTAVESITAWQDLVKAGYYHKGSMSFDYGQAAEEFQKGSAAMMFDGSWAAAGADASDNSNLGSFVIPTPFDNNSYDTANIYWGVSESSANKEAAFRFVDYVLGGNEDVYRTFLQADGYGSTTKEAVTYEQGPVMTEFLSNYEGRTLVPEITKVIGDGAIPAGLEDMINKAMQAIYTGADVKTELEKLDTETQKLLAAAE